jgi:protein-disulfide isomerase
MVKNTKKAKEKINENNRYVDDGYTSHVLYQTKKGHDHFHIHIGKSYDRKLKKNVETVLFEFMDPHCKLVAFSLKEDFDELIKQYLLMSESVKNDSIH